MVARTAYDAEGREVVECDGDVHFVERNLAGRETIRLMTDSIVEDLLRAREEGRNTFTIHQIREKAYQKAKKLVAEKAAQHEQQPLR